VGISVLANKPGEPKGSACFGDRSPDILRCVTEWWTDRCPKRKGARGGWFTISAHSRVTGQRAPRRLRRKEASKCTVGQFVGGLASLDDENRSFNVTKARLNVSLIVL